MSRAASPMQWLEVAHAVTSARFNPVIPYLIETWPDTMLTMLPGTKKGEMRRGPPVEYFS